MIAVFGTDYVGVADVLVELLRVPKFPIIDAELAYVAGRINFGFKGNGIER